MYLKSAAAGLHATLTAPHGGALTMPMIAWEGLLDALAASRKTRTRGDRGFAARSGARWQDGEAGQLAAGFRAGRSIAHLARAHNRTELAVEAQLERMGLWDRVQRRSTGPASKLNFQAPPDWPAALEPNVSFPFDRD